MHHNLLRSISFFDIYRCIYVSIPVFISFSLSLSLSLYIYIYIHIYIYICVCVCVCVCVTVCLYLFLSFHIYLSIYLSISNCLIQSFFLFHAQGGTKLATSVSPCNNKKRHKRELINI